MNSDDAGRKGNGMIWVAAGCGGLLLLTMGLATGGAIFYMRSASSRLIEPPAPETYYPGPQGGPSTGPMMPSGPGTPGSTASAEVNATVTMVTGSRPVPENATCSFRVEHQPNGQGGYWCRTQAVCGGRLLFGGPTAGYFPCTFEDGSPPTIVGGDPDTTSFDNDASFAIDTNEGRLMVRDDATGANGEYNLTAHIDSVQ